MTAFAAAAGGRAFAGGAAAAVSGLGRGYLGEVDLIAEVLRGGGVEEAVEVEEVRGAFRVLTNTSSVHEKRRKRIGHFSIVCN